MLDFLLLLLIVALGLAYVYRRLHKTNMVIPPGAEKRVNARAALRFALDNGLTIRTPMG